MLKNHFDLMSRSNELSYALENCICTHSNISIIEIDQGIKQCMESFTQARYAGSAVYLVGNGGSAGIVSHAQTDFLNVCKLRAFTLHDSSLITCMANDFGYENSFSRVLNTLARPGDLLVAVSSSGKSANICNAARVVKEKGGKVITLSGFKPDNPLRVLGDINFWLDSCDYGIVEMGHMFLLHNISDRIGIQLKNEQLVEASKITV